MQSYVKHPGKESKGQGVHVYKSKNSLFVFGGVSVCERFLPCKDSVECWEMFASARTLKLFNYLIGVFEVGDFDRSPVLATSVESEFVAL